MNDAQAIVKHCSPGMDRIYEIAAKTRGLRGGYIDPLLEIWSF
jgi:hypothetical protein